MSLHSKRPHHDRFARAAFDSPCSRWRPSPRNKADTSRSLRPLLRRRRILDRRRLGFLLLVLARLLLRRLQLVDDLLQRGDGALEALDLTVGGVQLLLMVGS